MDAFDRIERDTVDRYTARLQTFGDSPLTLGWGSREQQSCRFDKLLDVIDLAGKQVLDIGCGFGDLCGYLARRSVPVRSYTGIDINDDLLAIAARKYPEGKFIHASPVGPVAEGVAGEVGVMLGLLNFRQSATSNMTYCRAMVSKAFAMCDEALVFDALSARRDERYPEETAVFYYDPAEIVALAAELTPCFSLHHDYPSIPQREMLVVLRKTPSR